LAGTLAIPVASVKSSAAATEAMMVTFFMAIFRKAQGGRTNTNVRASAAESCDGGHIHNRIRHLCDGHHIVLGGDVLAFPGRIKSSDEYKSLPLSSSGWAGPSGAAFCFEISKPAYVSFRQLRILP
jgi:hypothetical protein